MLASAELFAALGMAVVALAFLGIGTFVGYVVSRQSAPRPVPAVAEQPPRPPVEVVNNLQDCLESGSEVKRNVEELEQVLLDDEFRIPPEARRTMQNLIKSTETLSNQLERAGQGSTHGAEETIPPAPALRPKTPPPSSTTSAPAKKHENEQASQQDEDEGSGADGRQFPRSACHGTLTATIYPPPHRPSAQPVRCTLLTRNLSCTGIGIAHSEQLFPRQIVVLDAVGKMLVGEVRWCRKLDERFFIAGCKLVKTNEQDRPQKSNITAL